MTTSKGPTTGAQKRLSAQRAAAARARIETAQRRRRIQIVGAIVGAALAIVAVLVAVKLASGPTRPRSGAQASAATGSVASDVAGVPASVLNQVGLGAVSSAPKALSGAALSTDGKPRVLFIGAEWCPYCAAERWPLAVALSRFGTLTGLGQVTSSPTDVYPSTATLTFHGASYASSYFSLTAKEVYSNQVQGNGYAPLDSLDTADLQLYTSAGSGFPFLDIGGRYLFNSASYNPQTLAGKTQAQIAAALADPTSAIAKAICSTTGNQPAAVCSSSGVVTAARRLPTSG
jgi:hypothetical protein